MTQQLTDEELEKLRDRLADTTYRDHVLLALIGEVLDWRKEAVQRAKAEQPLTAVIPLATQPFSWQPAGEWAFTRHSPDGLQEWQVVMSLSDGKWYWRAIDRQARTVVHNGGAIYDTWDDAAVACGQWWQGVHHD